MDRRSRLDELVPLGEAGVDALGAPPADAVAWTWAGGLASSLADHNDPGSWQLARQLDQLIRARLERDHALVDLAVVEALVLRQGCRVTIDVLGLPIAATPDPMVPYGEVYYVPQGVDLPEREA